MMDSNKKMGYRDVEDYILDIPKFTKKNKQEDTSLFYDFLGRPGERQKIIHVAGTNGKGSVCAYSEGILMECGYSCGLFTSPHLVTMRERMRIDREDISEQKFADLFCTLQDRLKEFQAEQQTDYHPTFFEMVFFMAMLWFEERKPDYIILETGMGGRLDATNVVQNKSLCIITKIAFDHMEYLGDTLEKIAAEKAGIIQRGTPVVYLYSEETAAVMENRVCEMETIGKIFQKSDLFDVKNHGKFIDFSFPFKYYGNSVVRLETYAGYQLQNAGLSLTAMELLLGRQLTPEIAVKALAGVKWPCRMEEILPDIFVDGAHNPDGMEAFLDSVQQIAGHRLLLFAVVKDKDYDCMIQKLVQSGLFDGIVITIAGGKRASNADEIKGDFLKFGYKGAVTVIEDAREAFEFCRDVKNGKRGANVFADTANCKLFVAGSLYLAGQIKALQNGVLSD